MTDWLTSNNVLRFAILVLVFAAVAVGAYAFMVLMGRRVAARGALASLTDSGPARLAATAGSLKFDRRESAWTRLADAVEKAGLNLTDTKSDRLRTKLIAAGFTNPAAPRIFTLTRLILVFLLPLLFVIFAYQRAQPPSFLTLYIFGSVLALFGLYAPNLYVQSKSDRRREAIVNGFPDCLDLLLVCVEAGLGIEAAMDRVGREMIVSHPLVAELLSVAVLQLRAGATREEAYRRLADMAGVDEIRSFSTLLIQSDKLGTSIAATLRIYAAEMRERRRMRAEEKAHRLPVLISIPLVVFMLPTMIGVLMLPASVRIVRDIFPLMVGR